MEIVLAFPTPCLNALRILTVLTDVPAGCVLPFRAIARWPGLPANSAGKLCQRLVRRGLLLSRRGPAGGYGLARPAKAIFLADIFKAVGRPLARHKRCCFLSAHCPQTRPCVLHARVRLLESGMFRALERSSLAAWSASRPQGRPKPAGHGRCGRPR